MRRVRVSLAVMALAASLLSGCASVQVDDHSYQFNEATGSLGLRLLLLNAVRASKDYPLQFSKINAYQGTGTMGGSISASMPLTGFPGNGAVSPKVDWKDGISQLNLIDLNTEEAQQALRRTISFNTYDYYYKYGGRRSFGVTYMIMTEHIALAHQLHALIKTTAQERCGAYLSGKGVASSRLPQNKFACKALQALEKECPDLYSPAVHPSGAVLLRNDLSTECKHKAFLAGSLQFDILGVAVAANHDSKTDRSTTTTNAGGNTFNIYVADSKGGEDKKGDEKGTVYVFDRTFGERCARASLCTLDRRRGVHIFSPNVALFQFRSPERMVRYLGELVAAQNYGAGRFVPSAVDIELQEVFTLLTVVRGMPPPGGAAVSVRDPEGEMFYVPRSNYDLPRKDRSLETLSLVSEVLNGAVSKKAFPQVTTFTVSPTP